jgi:branched-chain amino acid transport system ATP-binding protein
VTAERGPLLTAKEIRKRFGALVVLDGVDFSVSADEAVGIVGPNGAGKTTYFNLISGQLRLSEGSVALNDEDISRLSPAARAKRGLGRAFQLTNLFPNLSVHENVRLVLQARAKRGFDLVSMAEVHRDLSEAADAVLARMRLSGFADRPAATLSHGNQRKLEVALLVALEPQIFMFDEPTAGMSVDEMPAVLDLIASLKSDATKTILLVEHKMDVIRALADRIVVLHQGRLVAEGDPQEVVASPIVQEAYLGRAPSEARG